MMWGKIDDRYDDHPKVKAATRRDSLAAAMHAQGIPACARHESDGLLDPLWLEERAPSAVRLRKVLAVLEELRLFDRLPAGETWSSRDEKGFEVVLGPFPVDRWLLHDFLDFNPSSVQLQAKRAQDAERKREEALRRTREREDFQPDSNRIPTGGETNSTRRPDGSGVDSKGSSGGVHVGSPARALAPSGAGSGRVGSGPGFQGEEEKTNSQGENEGTPRKTRAVDQSTPPPALLEQLHPVAGEVLVMLRRVQAERGGMEPTLRGVGLAVAAFPDRDHLQAAQELEHWATAGRGQRQVVRDWVRTFRTFLERTPAGAPSRTAAGRRASVVATSPASEDDTARWEEIAARLRGDVDESTWGTWLAPLHPHGSSNGRLVLGGRAPVVQWVRERFGRLLKEAAGGDVEIVACGCEPAGAKAA